jgi:hypothetical protein
MNVVTTSLLLLALNVRGCPSGSVPFRAMCKGEPERRETSGSGARVGVAAEVGATIRNEVPTMNASR